MTPWSKPWKANRSSIKKLSAFYGTQKFIDEFTRACQLSTSSAKWIRFMSFHPISSKAILKLVPHLCQGITRVSFLPGLQPKSCVCVFLFTLYATHDPSIPSHTVQITQLIIIMEFSPLSSYSLHLKPKYPIYRPILYHPRPMRFS